MYEDEIKSILKRFNIPEVEIPVFLSSFKVRELGKGDLFLSAGLPQESAGIVIKGLFRYYYIDKDGNEHSKHFAFDGDLVMSFSSYINNSNSEFFIEAVEGSVILSIDTEKLKVLLNNNGTWRDIYYKTLEQLYCLKEKRAADLLMKNATERYQDFLKEHPGVETRLKQIYIASFLGIKPESLSRIRKTLV